ncbi:MAG: DMT family transporter [Filifactoraceae bacterium]
MSLDKNKKATLYADLSLLIVAFLWGAGFLFMKSGLNHITPFWIMSLRFIGATIVMSLVFFKRILKVNRKDIKGGFIIGLFMFAGFITQTIGLQYTSISSQAFLTGTNVAFVPFFVWLVYKKKPDNFAMVGAFLALIGIALITLKEGLTLNIGDLWTLACAVFFAGHIVSIGYFAKKSDPIVLTIIQLAVTGVLSVIGGLIFEEPINFLALESSAYVTVLYLVFGSTLLAFLLQNIAQKYTPATHASLILCLESVIGTMLGVIFYKDLFNTKMALGCMFIFIAIITIETQWEFLVPNKDKSLK